MSETPEKKSGGGKKILLIVFILLLAGINGFQVWMHFQNEEKHQSEITEKDTEIEGLKEEAAQLLTDLEEARNRAEELGLNVDSLNVQIEELRAINDDLERTKNAGWAKYRAIKGQIAGFKELLVKKDVEIAAKDSLMAIQKANIDSLQVDKNKLITEKTELTNERDGLQSKVNIASVLRAENIVITMLNAKGKEYTKQPWKVKKIDKIKIAFNLGKNAVADAGTRAISIRIVEPGGAALYDLATGGGSFSADGKEIFYSAKQDIMFANKNEMVNFMYAKGSLFKAGEHTLEIYEAENLIGKGKFTTK